MMCVEVCWCVGGVQVMKTKGTGGYVEFLWLQNVLFVISVLLVICVFKADLKVPTPAPALLPPLSSLPLSRPPPSPLPSPPTWRIPLPPCPFALALSPLLPPRAAHEHVPVLPLTFAHGGVAPTHMAHRVVRNTKRPPLRACGMLTCRCAHTRGIRTTNNYVVCGSGRTGPRKPLPPRTLPMRPRQSRPEPAPMSPPAASPRGVQEFYLSLRMLRTRRASWVQRLDT